MKTSNYIQFHWGLSLNGLSILNHSFDGNSTHGVSSKSNLIKTAFLYLNAPYLWGGKTPFGIDCSGLYSNGLQT